ncbi:hypothetical protein D3C71_1368720 [compost metagenome]
MLELDVAKGQAAGHERTVHDLLNGRFRRHPQHTDLGLTRDLRRHEAWIDHAHRADQHRQARGERADAIEAGMARHHPLAAYPAKGWLESKHPAAARGNAHRTASVRAQAEIRQPRRHRSSRATGRTARNTPGEVGIHRGTGVAVDTGGAEGQLMQADFGGQAGASGQQMADHIGMLRGQGGVLQRLARRPRRGAGDVDGVFDDDPRAGATQVKGFHDYCHCLQPWSCMRYRISAIG